jgi:glycerol-3-phosphate dehydrogenase
VNRYFAWPIGPGDVVWHYAGVRPLYDDGETDPSEVTRDYVLTLDAPAGAAPLLSVFGGKITTARKLAEHALEKLEEAGFRTGPAWTGTAPLPGGEMVSFPDFLAALQRDFAGLDAGWLEGLARRHGTRARALLDGARTAADLGLSFGGGLFGREVDWLQREEWAAEPEDILWRRTKCGLHMTAAERDALAGYMASSRSG